MHEATHMYYVISMEALHSIAHATGDTEHSEVFTRWVRAKWYDDHT